MSNKLLPIGTKVFDVRYGWGEVIETNSERYYPIKVSFNNNIGLSYTENGYYESTHNNPILSLTEYNLKDGGFTPITEFDPDAPKVGDVGYFWNSEKQLTISYSKIIEISNGCFINPNYTQWENFSKEVPQWFIEKMEKPL